MGIREDAQEFLVELYSCIPKSFYSELETTQRSFGFVLDHLEHTNSEVIAGDFASLLNVSPARIAVLLKRLEQNGFITRHTSSKDARRTVVEITPAGIAFVDEMREQILRKVELLLKQISKEDLYTYIKISHQIKRAMDE